MFTQLSSGNEKRTDGCTDGRTTWTDGRMNGKPRKSKFLPLKCQIYGINPICTHE